MAVRWLPWRPRWRRTFKQRAKDAIAPAEAVGDWAILEPVFYVVLAVVVFLLLVAVVITVAAWIAALAGVAAGAAARLILRQPFLVEATTPSGDWSGWWVVGWRRARSARVEVEAALRGGAPVKSIRPAAALTHRIR